MTKDTKAPLLPVRSSISPVYDLLDLRIYALVAWDSTNSLTAFLGRAPTKLPATSPFFNANTAGMLAIYFRLSIEHRDILVIAFRIFSHASGPNDRLEMQKEYKGPTRSFTLYLAAVWGHSSTSTRTRVVPLVDLTASRIMGSNMWQGLHHLLYTESTFVIKQI